MAGSGLFVLSVVMPRESVAQSALPPVTVEAPKHQQQARRTQPARRAARAARTTPRSIANRAPAQAQNVPAPGSGGGGERGNGPVTGYLASQSVTATKTDTPVLTTPQSISIVTQDQIQAQGAQNITEALRYTPGVTIESFGANAFFDEFKLRGFTAPRYLDGLRLPTDTTTFAVPRIETYGLERIEVLKGPSSGLYGQSDPGGLLNLVSKRPTETPHYEIEGAFGSFDRFQGAFDIGGPADKDGRFLYRIVGLGRDSNSQTDFVQDNKLFIAPSFTWRPTYDISFTVLSQYQKVDNKGYQQYVPGQVSFLPNPNGHIPYSRYLGEPGLDGYHLEQFAVGYAFEHRFDNIFQFRQNLRYTQVSNDLASVRTEGMVTDRLVARTYNYVKANAANVALDNQLQADFATGPLVHKVLAGVDYFDLWANTDYRTTPIAPIDAYSPVYGTAVPSASSLAPFILRDDRQSQLGAYLQDQIKLDRWTLTMSGRQDWVSSGFTSMAFYPPAGHYSRDDSAQTGRIGLSYLFDIGLAPYVSYATSFTPNLGADSAGRSFRPTTGEGAEVGVKFKPNGSNFMVTAAAFDIRQQDVLTADPINPLFNVQTDAVRVRGLELELKGNLTREFEITAGYTHLDPRVTTSIAGYAGKYMMNTAQDQGAVWGKYTWYDGALAGLGLGLGVRYVGETYGDNFNTFVIPSYALLDASVSYDFAYLRPDLKGWKAQVNVTNLTDHFYVASCLTGLPYCGLGNGRTVLGTMKYTWN
ncbi:MULTISPECIES: TonB-dependent siderophore receptor [Bradyrhizobium]|uniref:TonB-dependent siderophore receptor n=1 Tax=Bradyrhizobium elkanii TaxID=29448 RepID=UPI00271473B6|nr:TonB-dependent siderophore receptor [Bradyrhizobium elkanii]WLA47045.1 TonB-dependent siderophore receptor [Bradyrhizobium elkanii]WLB82673.1 TonB-dependent siderophore receptor [Bradyrhizobium elkanii]